MDQIIGQWRPIAGLEDRYEVSDQGQVRSLPRVTMRGNAFQRVRGKLIAQRQSADGYKRVTLITPTGRVHKQVHRLVAEAFCDKRQGCNVVNHIDNCPGNNWATNLEWTTPLGNSEHMWGQGRGRVPVMRGEQSPAYKYTEDQAISAIKQLREGVSHSQIAIRLGVTRSFVADISCGRRWRHLPR